MKLFFRILCLVLGCGVSQGDVQNQPDQDKPSILIVESDFQQKRDKSYHQVDYYNDLGQQWYWFAVQQWWEYSHYWEDGGIANGEWMDKDTYSDSEGSSTDVCMGLLDWPASYWPLLANGTATASGYCEGVYEVFPPVIGLEHCDVEYSKQYSPPPSRESSGWSTKRGSVSYARQAQTKMRLYTGGKPFPRRQSVYVFTATANQILNPRAEPPFAGIPTLPISPETIVVGSLGRQGLDGLLYKALPDGQSFDVTPEVLDKRFYKFTVSHTEHRPVIKANGTTLDPAQLVSNSEFCVGQQVMFELQFEPSLSFVNHVSRWNLPALYVNQPHNIGSAGCVVYDINANLLTNLTTSCWYVDGQGGTASIGTSLRFPNNQTTSVAAAGLFTVVAPVVVSNTWACGGINMFTNSSGSLTELALGGSNSVGMEFFNHLQRPERFSGRAWHTQLINRDISYNTPFGSETDTTSGAFWLDTAIHYQEPVNFPIVNSVGNPVSPIRPVGLPDSPGQPAGMFGFWDRVEVKDDFKAYLRWQPDGANSIPVTVGRIDWGWHGKAVNTNGSWSLTVSNWYGPTFIWTDKSDPNWTNIYSH